MLLFLAGLSVGFLLRELMLGVVLELGGQIGGDVSEQRVTIQERPPIKDLCLATSYPIVQGSCELGIGSNPCQDGFHPAATPSLGAAE